MRLVARMIIALAAAAAVSLPAVPAHAEMRVTEIPVEGLDPSTVTIEEPQPAVKYHFQVDLPQDASMQFVNAAGAGVGQWSSVAVETTGGVLVVNSDGSLVGAFDQPIVVDAEGNFLPTTYHIEGDILVQTVDVSGAAAFPVVLEPVYSPASVQTTSPGRGIFSRFVSVPADYAYNPALGPRHDYCTLSPDEFPSPIGGNADFRGPCARHDMCYDTPGSDHLACDRALHADLVDNCGQAYTSAWDPNRQACFSTALIYLGAVASDA